MNSARTVLLVEATLPDYRQSFLEGLRAELGDRLRVRIGETYFTPGVRIGVDLPGLTVIRNQYLLGRKVLWQREVIKPALAAEVVILELNPRILSTWVVLIARRILRRRRSILWGHAWPRRGSSARSDRVRNWQRRLADCLVVLTETEAAALRLRMPGFTIVAAPNAMYSRDRFRPRPSGSEPFDFLYVGRLVPDKKPDLLLAAFAQALAELPARSNLVFVGEGPMSAALMEQAREAAISTRVRFEGHQFDHARLARYYSDALMSVSPGYVGLSLTQSLSFGVPMIIARDEPHAPEIEAAREGMNCLFFDRDSIEDLARVMIVASATRRSWIERAEEIVEHARDRYTTEVMVDRMVSAIRSLDGNADPADQ